MATRVRGGGGGRVSGWKQAHARQAARALGHELVRDVMEELRVNLRAPEGGLEVYGIAKVASYAAQVARAQALGFDPDLLRLSDEEADEEILKIARQAAESEVPVWVVDPSEPEAEGPA